MLLQMKMLGFLLKCLFHHLFKLALMSRLHNEAIVNGQGSYPLMAQANLNSNGYFGIYTLQAETRA